MLLSNYQNVHLETKNLVFLILQFGFPEKQTQSSAGRTCITKLLLGSTFVEGKEAGEN